MYVAQHWQPKVVGHPIQIEPTRLIIACLESGATAFDGEYFKRRSFGDMGPATVAVDGLPSLAGAVGLCAVGLSLPAITHG